MVILAPISQLGCFNACSLVTCCNCSIVNLRKGPPEAVRITFSRALPGSRHWKMAECSESTGRIGVWYCCAKALINSPATTNVSLFAKAIAFPARMAFIVGRKPA